MKLVLSLSLILFTTLVITFATPAVAQGNAPAATSTIKVKQHLVVKSTKQAAQIAQSRFGGKVLKVQVKKSAYKVKLIKKNGHIITISVDAKSGLIKE